MSLETASVSQISGPQMFNMTSVNSLSHTVALTVLSDYDEQVQGMTLSMTHSNEQKASLRAMQSNLSGISEQQTTTVQVDESNNIVQGQDGASSVQAYHLTTGTIEALLNQFQEFDLDTSVLEAAQTNGGYVAKTSLEKMSQAIDVKIQDLNSVSDIKMIQLQSLLDARKQALMMLTNLMQSSSQTAMSIIQNMRA